MSLSKNRSVLFIFYLLILTINGFWGYWWLNLMIGFLVGYLFFDEPLQAFKINFLVIFLYWGILSLIKDREVGGMVSAFLSSLANDMPAFLFYLITALVGGFLTGWASSIGSQLRSLSKPSKP